MSANPWVVPSNIDELRNEFHLAPFGRHSPQLQALLSEMRSAPIPGKAFLYMDEPQRTWMLARMSAEEPLGLEVADQVIYHNLEDAERDVFDRRLAGMANQPHPQPAYRRIYSAPSVTGYARNLSVRPGDRLEVCTSSTRDETYEVQVLRLYRPDVGPIGEPAGHERIDSTINGVHNSVAQYIRAGSYASAESDAVTPDGFGVSVRVMPTLLADGPRTLLALTSQRHEQWALRLHTTGVLEWAFRGADGRRAQIVSGVVLRVQEWWAVAAFVDSRSHTLTLGAQRLGNEAWSDQTCYVVTESVEAPSEFGTGPWTVTMAARPITPSESNSSGAEVVPAMDQHFDGRLERPRLYAGAFDEVAIRSLITMPADAAVTQLVADWDFSVGIQSDVVTDVCSGNVGRLVNLPTRGVRGSMWSGRTLEWPTAPQEYGAIHFHSDDVGDAQWQTTLAFDVPETWASGCYAVHLSAGRDEFFIPYFVRSREPGTASDVAFIVPTATYAAYANMRLRLFGRAVELQHGRLTVVDATDLLLAEWPELGGSTYDMHRDGSPVCYSSMRRPITNFRPSGRIYKFCQDLLVTAWLKHIGVPFEIITDEDIDRAGVESLLPYRVLITSSHPEYVSVSMEQTLGEYLGAGGRLMYLGGNGYYTASEFHPSLSGTVEVRRPGLEALWPMDHTEGTFSFTGMPAGPLAKIGRRAEPLVGVAFITQGFDASSYYRRSAGTTDDRFQFVFDGVCGEIIGDHGILQGGAAGYEIDRFDAGRGSPPHAIVLASSEAHSNVYELMVPSLVDTFPNRIPGTLDPIRADIVFFETRHGGAVFSVGSIAWSGSLATNGYFNDVAKVSGNVLARFLDAEAFTIPTVDRTHREEQ